MSENKYLRASFNSALKAFVFLRIFFCLTVAYGQYEIRGQVIDDVSKEKLPYAPVYFQQVTTVTNSEGVFVLKSAAPITWVSVAYLGYKTETRSILPNTEFITIKLTAQAHILNDVLVSAKESTVPYQLFFTATESIRRKGQKLHEAKAFFRSYTAVDGNYPAEWLECYYNVKCNALELASSQLKAGRFLLPSKVSYQNMSSIALISYFKPFLNDQELFPYTPYVFDTWRQVRRNYRIQIIERTPIDNDTIIRFKFTARDTTAAFSGEMLYRVKGACVDKIYLKANHIARIPFYSIADSANNKFSNLGYDIEMGFRSTPAASMLNYVIFKRSYDITTRSERKHLDNSMKLMIYDVDDKFPMPIFESILVNSDYERITYFPYNAYFFSRTPVIAENTEEEKLRKSFDSIPCYDSRKQNSFIPFLPNRIESWTMDWTPNQMLVQPKSVDYARRSINKFKNETKKAEWDSSFASTMLYLDYDCYPDTIIFKTSALIDYKYSYMLNLDSITSGYFKMYLDLAQIAAEKMLYAVRHTYSKNCPTEEQMLKLYNEYNNSYGQDIYNLYANSNSRYKRFLYSKLKKIISAQLAELKGQPFQKNNDTR